MSESQRVKNRSVDSFQDKGIWIFVGIDLIIFSLFFVVFLVEKANSYQLFDASRQQLDSTIGFTNTLFLLTSSWMLLLAIKYLDSSKVLAKKFLAGSIVFGALFVVLKLFEYYQKISIGITPVDNTFFTFYFLLTFIHFCHVIAGLIALSVVYSWFESDLDASKVSFLDSVGVYWHMVDLLWVFLFLLLYLLG